MYEQKKDNAFLLTHLGLGDIILCIGMINYISESYKKVYVVCKERNYDNLQLLIKNPKVELLKVIDDHYISPNHGFNKYMFEKLTKNWDVYLCGKHKLDNTPSINFPLGFYDDIKIERKIFWTYFNYYNSEESASLYNKIKEANIEKYIVVHNLSSNGKVFDSKSIIKNYASNSKNLLVINFNMNEYNKTNKFYNIAQEFVNKPLAYYQDLIINAEYIFMTDSSIWCMSIQLPIKTDNCYYISRGNVSYDHLYNEEIYKFAINKKKFKQISYTLEQN